jgi:asparagine synthase (glutamine-hydrolysing)
MGVWHEGRVAFGHRRLASLDPSATASQPMLTGDGTGILICDGEIYNHRALRRDLENDGVRSCGSDDTEVLLHALHNWGPERILPRLNGVFAFAYLDRRRGELWLARDRLGTKPLLVANTGAELLFASEAKALLAHPRMETGVDRHALTRWLLERGEGPDKPPFLGMTQLEPGSWWKVSEQGIDKRQYFHALTAIDVDRLVAASSTKPANFVSQFRDDLKRSIELRLEPRAPLAVMCSGGVDSSLIAAYAKEQLPELTGYVADVAFPDSEAAEAERAGRHLGIPIRRVVVDQPRFLALWPYTVWHSDGPTTHPSDAALLAVLQTCRADGVRSS